MDERLSPIAAKDVSGLPPAYILTAGFDPLREEAIAYAAKLKAAGVTVTHVDYPTMIHGFLTMQGWIPLAGQAISAAGQAVKERAQVEAAVGRTEGFIPFGDCFTRG